MADSISAGDIADLADFLKILPDTTDRAFEERIGKKISQSGPDIKEQLQYILDHEKDPEIRFRAFFGLTFYLRRQNNFSEFKRTVDQHLDEFANFALHLHILALLHKSMGDESSLKQAIQYSRQAIEALPNHIGVLHCFCDCVVTAQEEGIEIDEQYMREASRFIDKILAQSPDYAKFYCTKGRICAQNGNFSEAKKYIMKAIDMENDRTNDYSIRISDYKNYLAQIKSFELFKKVEEGIKKTEDTLKAAQHKIEDQAEQTTKKLEDLKTQNLQILGFFTALISFILTSINVLGNHSFSEAAQLILILNGSMILAYAAFSILFVPIEKMLTKLIVASIAGLAMIAAGLIANLMLS